MHIILTLNEPGSEHVQFPPKKWEDFFLPINRFCWHNMRFSLARLTKHYPWLPSLARLSLLAMHNRHLYKSLNSTFRSVAVPEYVFLGGRIETETWIEGKPLKPFLLQTKGLTDWFVPPAHLCHHRRYRANTAVMAGRQMIPTSLCM